MVLDKLIVHGMVEVRGIHVAATLYCTELEASLFDMIISVVVLGSPSPKHHCFSYSCL